MPGSPNQVSFRLLPGCCLLCGRRGKRHRDLCHDCQQDLPWLSHACARCATPLPAPLSNCGSCLKARPVQDKSLAAFRYAWPLDIMIQHFKFNGDHATGQLLGELLGELFAERVHLEDELPHCLLPVPLHSRRLRERGFNQSALLSGSVAKRLGIDVRDDLVRRVRETAVQSGMDAIARRRNVRNAFALRSEDLPAHVAILDDVVTTGSTTAEIAKLLRKAGVRTIEVWTLAKAV